MYINTGFSKIATVIYVNKIDNFLKRFHSSNNIDEVFTSGCCYWFAVILFGRFIREGAEIMYDDVANHFGTKIGNKVYDITGDVTDSYNWLPWNDINDESHRKRIEKDCIMF